MNPRILGTCAAAALLGLISGCSTQQQQPAPAPQPVVAEPAPAPSQMAPAGYKIASAAFPTGDRSTSAMYVEKIVPERVLAGEPFDTVYKLTNLTPLTLQEVVLTDSCIKNENFRLESSSPAPTSDASGEMVWVIGELAPRATREIRISGVASDEGVLKSCGKVTFQPYVCETVEVVRPAISLTKIMPEESNGCELIPVKLVVKNDGSSVLTGVKVTDALPTGMVVPGSEIGSGKLVMDFDAGTLAPGQSKEFTFNAQAVRKGTFTNPAKVTTAEGVEASTEATVNVRVPQLSVVCETPRMREMTQWGGLRFTQFIGRPFEVCWSVENTGDAPATGVKLDVTLPAGLTLQPGGTATLAGNVASWNIGAIAPGASKKVCGTFTAAVSGELSLNASVAGVCAKPATTSCGVTIQGVNAILTEVVDDPDPIQVGEQTTYTIRVTNQGGGLDLTDLAIVANFPAGIDPVSASNGGAISGKKVTWPVVSAVPTREAVTYTVVGRAVAEGDSRLQVEVTTAGRQSPIVELESTTVY